MFEVGRWAAAVAMAFSLTIGPGEPPAWRSEPRVRVAAVLLVGEPTPWLPARLGPAFLSGR
ncbi:hypothetical protein HQ535_07560 [bacterium]|nr:hypothetical protein [bacterium]